MSKGTILICDDDSSIRTLLKIVLEEEGYETITASDEREAIAKAKENQLDCIILDITMPFIDGFEVLGILRAFKFKEGKRIPIIVLTARDKIDDKLRGIFQGADAYLTKPFDLTTLRETVEEVLEANNS